MDLFSLALRPPSLWQLPVRLKWLFMVYFGTVVVFCVSFDFRMWVWVAPFGESFIRQSVTWLVAFFLVADILITKRLGREWMVRMVGFFLVVQSQHPERLLLWPLADSLPVWVVFLFLCWEISHGVVYVVHVLFLCFPLINLDVFLSVLCTYQNNFCCCFSLHLPIIAAFLQVM